MKVLLFGATGMVGQGVLRECLEADDVSEVVAIVRTPLERIPRVDETECVGCNLCSLVCPVDGCITMLQIDNGLPPMSWKQKMSGGARQ